MERAAWPPHSTQPSKRSIHLQEFTIQTSLSIARDRVVGILLGLIMMWLVFDQLWGARAALK
jgi:multidrug resistance protein MdtO